MADQDESVLLADPRMADLPLLTDPAALLQVIDARVAPALLPGRRPVQLTLSDMTYRPLRQCFGLCSLSLDDGSEAAMIISFAKSGEAKSKVFDVQYGGRRKQPAVYLPEIDALFELFPNDWAVPALRRIFDQERLARIAASAGIEKLTASSAAPRIISYRPHEAAVLSLPGLVAPDGPLVVKVFAERERATRLHRSAAALRRSLTGLDCWTPPTYRSPNEPRAVFMPHIPGKAVFEAPDTEAALTLAGRALAAIHATPITRPRTPFTLAQGVKRARARMDRVALVAPGLANRATGLLDRLGDLSDVTPRRPVFLHGDYKNTQLLVHEGRTAVIDLDSTKLGDPAADLGNFLADLHREAVMTNRPELRGLAAAFLSGYTEAGGSADAFADARRYRVAVLARMAMHSFRQHSRQQAGYRNDVPLLLLQEAERCLAEQ